MRSNAFRWILVILTIAALTLVSACNKGGGPTGPSDPPETQYINIPAPATPDQAFLKYRRPDDAVVINSGSRATAFNLTWTDSGRYHSKHCESSNVNWNPESEILTCLKAFEGEDKLPVDTQIQLWANDEGTYDGSPQSFNRGRVLVVNSITLPEPSLMGEQPFPVATFKLRADGTVYW